MKKVLVIGAGAQGGPCTAILSGEKGIEEIRLGDINLEMANKVAEKIGAAKVKPFKLDASNKDELIAAAEGVDVIFNFTLIKFNHKIMQAAIRAGAHYVDTACSGEFLDEWIELDEPKLHQEFKSIGKTALAGMGFAPGVANVLTRYACDQMDRVERIIIRAGRGTSSKSEDVVSAWKPTWSPEILLEDYADPPLILSEGEFKVVPIFSNPETYAFPEPIGDLLLSSHMHEEPYLIPKFYMDKGLKELDFKYPVDKTVGAFIKMGFADDRMININGVEINPRDVLMKLVQRPGNKFLEENEKSVLNSDLTGIMDVSVEGERAGENVTHLISYRFTDGQNKLRQSELYKAYGTTMLHVALPAVVGAKMCMSGAVKPGVISPDCIVPETFFEGMADRGVPFKFNETISKDIELSNQ